MTERAWAGIIAEAKDRRYIMEAPAIYRIGALNPVDQNVLLVTNADRRTAFRACEFVMDYLSTQVPF